MVNFGPIMGKREERQHISIRVMIQRRGRMRKENPIASPTGLLDGHVVQRRGKREGIMARYFRSTPASNLQWASRGIRDEHKQMRLHPWAFVSKPVSSTGCMHVCALPHTKPQI
jgi:hypothetical protein